MQQIVRKIIELAHPHIFGRGVWCTQLNLWCMILSSIDTVDGLMTCTREGRNSSSLSLGTHGSILFMVLTLGCSYLRLQRLDLLAISSSSSTYWGLLMFESVKIETTISRGCESPCVFIEVVLIFGWKTYLGLGRMLSNKP